MSAIPTQVHCWKEQLDQPAIVARLERQKRRSSHKKEWVPRMNTYTASPSLLWHISELNESHRSPFCQPFNHVMIPTPMSTTPTILTYGALCMATSLPPLLCAVEPPFPKDCRVAAMFRSNACRVGDSLSIFVPEAVMVPFMGLRLCSEEDGDDGEEEVPFQSPDVCLG